MTILCHGNFQSFKLGFVSLEQTQKLSDIFTKMELCSMSILEKNNSSHFWRGKYFCLVVRALICKFSTQVQVLVLCSIESRFFFVLDYSESERAVILNLCLTTNHQAIAAYLTKLHFIKHVLTSSIS